MYKVYQVLEGDNLEKIAKGLGVSVADLLELNGLENDAVVTPGMFLVVPAKKNFFLNIQFKKEILFILSQVVMEYRLII